MSDDHKNVDSFNSAAKGPPEPPKQTYAQRKIEELNKQRPKPTYQLVPTPRGQVRVQVISKSHHDKNAAIDGQIEFWKEQHEKTAGNEGELKQEFGKAKARDKARSSFDNAR